MNRNPNSTAVFRPMRTEDHGVVARMMKSLYRALALPEGYITDEKIGATFEQLCIQPTHLSLEVFELDGAVVGYALLFKFWYNELGGMVLNVDELFVESDFRSKGIAAHYLSRLSERSERDYVALSLEVLPENKGAYSLYKRTGFIEKETVTLYKIL
jgi:ribosomal protein S18 acetylase RimI-like enzyme